MKVFFTVAGLLSLLSCLGQSIDGIGNNLLNPSLGAAHTQLLRLSKTNYDDGFSNPRMNELPNPRLVSNEIIAQDFPIYDLRLSDFFWVFGQFIDHDLVLNRGNSGETIQINVPIGDEIFDPAQQGRSKMQISRSKVFGDDSIRQHENETTAFIDASLVYGVSDERLEWLRSKKDGKLKVSEDQNLPYNTNNGKYTGEIDYSAPFMEISSVPRPEKFYVAGDIRAFEHPGLAMMHTLFVREHNRLCDHLKENNPSWTDDDLFYAARKYVIAFLQAITYFEWLPYLGINLFYEGYNATIDPSVSSEFSTTAFRFGHSLVGEQILRLDENGTAWKFGSIGIQNAFFSSEEILNEGGIDPIIRGLHAQNQQKLDQHIVGALRNFLFGPPEAGGMDLAVANILRARERGIPGLNDIRESMGLRPYESFLEMTNDAPLAEELGKYYQVDNIDPWVAMLAERKADDSILGATMMEIIKDQFYRIMHGDRYWFENDPYFSTEDVEEIKNTTLADIIKRNSGVTAITRAFEVNALITSVENDPYNDISSFSIKAYPNPFYDHLNVNISSQKQWDGQLQLHDLSGKLLTSVDLNILPGDNEVHLQPGINTKGTFILRIISEGGIEILKVSKQ